MHRYIARDRYGGPGRRENWRVCNVHEVVTLRRTGNLVFGRNYGYIAGLTDVLRLNVARDCDALP